jgi:hypothetical protein
LASEILRLIIFLNGSKTQKDLFAAANEVLNEDWRLINATLLTIEGTQVSSNVLSYLSSYRNIAIHILVRQVMLVDIGTDAYFKAALELVHSWFPWGGDLENLPHLPGTRTVAR